jgi:hypothetical protein
MTGPVQTRQQAMNLPGVRAVYAAAHASAERGVMGERNHQMLADACTAAGVGLGAYDHRILAWLAGFEPEVCAVLAGIIGRAAASRDGAR